MGEALISLNTIFLRIHIFIYLLMCRYTIFIFIYTYTYMDILKNEPFAYVEMVLLSEFSIV